MMRRERTERSRQPTAGGFDELDDIVAQVFASLDGGDLADEETPIGPRRPIEQRNARQRRAGAAAEDRDLEEVAEGDMPPPSSYPEEGAEQSFIDRPGAAAVAELQAGGLRSSAGSLALAADEEDFVRQAAAWLATRPDAERLLNQVRVAIFEYHAAAERLARPIAADDSGGPGSSA
jgi:hypothetical protein